MTEKVSIGVDVGGTGIKLGLSQLDGTILGKQELPTDMGENGTHVLPDIAESIRKTMEETFQGKVELISAGIDVLGLVRSTGYVGAGVNLHWQETCPMRELSDLLGDVHVEVRNDVNVAALGGAWRGGGEGAASAVPLILDTGASGGVIMNGEIATGEHGLVGEVGHIHVHDGETEPCNYDAVGCLEQITSITSIVREVKRRLAQEKTYDSGLRAPGDRLTAEDVCDLGRAGDGLADEAMEIVTKYPDETISMLCMTADPEIFIISGGVSRAGAYLLDKTRVHYDHYTKILRNHGRVVLAELGNGVGVYGAIRLVLG